MALRDVLQKLQNICAIFRDVLQKLQIHKYHMMKLSYDIHK